MQQALRTTLSLYPGIEIRSSAGDALNALHQINSILGLVGASVGGWLSSLLFGADLTTRFNLTSLVVAVIGAVIVISIVRPVTGRR